jgi:hypothetical protein
MHLDLVLDAVRTRSIASEQRDQDILKDCWGKEWKEQIVEVMRQKERFHSMADFGALPDRVDYTCRN